MASPHTRVNIIRYNIWWQLKATGWKKQTVKKENEYQTGPDKGSVPQSTTRLLSHLSTQIFFSRICSCPDQKFDLSQIKISLSLLSGSRTPSTEGSFGFCGVAQGESFTQFWQRCQMLAQTSQRKHLKRGGTFTCHSPSQSCATLSPSKLWCVMCP